MTWVGIFVVNMVDCDLQCKLAVSFFRQDAAEAVAEVERAQVQRKRQLCTRDVL